MNGAGDGLYLVPHIVFRVSFKGLNMHVGEMARRKMHVAQKSTKRQQQQNWKKSVIWQVVQRERM